jgi:hypothetical protein
MALQVTTVEPRHTHEDPNTHLQRDVHTLYCARIYFCLTRFQQYHRSFILPDNSHHSSLGPFRVTAGRVALAAIPHCRESILCTSVHQTAVNIRFLLAMPRRGRGKVVLRLAQVHHVKRTRYS